MAFTDNPLIASLGHALGLDPLFGGAAGMGGGEGAAPTVPPGASPQAVKLPPPGRSKQNIPPYRNRPYVPRNITGTEGHGITGQGPVVEPGAMSPETLQSPEVQELLGKFGVDSNVNVDPNLFIHNQNLWQNHPHIAGALEGILSGAAFTHGGQTIGDSISAVAQGLLGSQAAHTEHINSQLMAPFAQASAVAGLQNQDAAIQEHKAQMQHLQDMSSYYKKVADNKANEDNIRAQAQQAQLEFTRQRLQYEQQLAQYREDPNRTLQEAVQKHWTADMKKKYGSEDAIPLQEYLRFQNSQLMMQGRDKIGIRYDEFKPNATGSQENEATKNKLGVLKDEYDKLDSEIKTAETNSMPIPDPNDPTGKRQLLPMSTDRSNYVNGLKQKRDAINQQREKLSGISSGSPTTTSTPAPSNVPSGASVFK